VRVLHYEHMGVGVILSEEMNRLGVESRVLATAPHPFGFEEDMRLPERRGLGRIARLGDWARLFDYDVFHNHDNHYVPSLALRRWKNAFVQHHHGPTLTVPLVKGAVNLVSMPGLTRVITDAKWIPLPARTAMFRPEGHVAADAVRVGFCVQAFDPGKPQMIPVEQIRAVIDSSGGLAETRPLESVILQSRMHEYYGGIDIWVDRIGAGFYGFSAVEAAAMGIPVITQIGEYERDFVPDCPFLSTGPDGISTVLAELISDQAMREDLGHRSREYAVARHGASTVARMCLSEYERLG
jgi:hypothetical protein